MSLGAYAIERDYSHYVTYASKTVFAVVGTATKGPENTATLCTNVRDLINKFGPLRTDCYALYAGQYYLSQASRLYFVRAASSSAAESHVNIAGMNDAATPVAVSDAITIAALEKGTYADGYIVTVADADTEGKYNLTVKSANNITLESISNVDIDDLTTSYKTNYIKVTAKNVAAVELTVGNYTLAGGNDGITGITSSDYITAANTLSADLVDMNLFAIPGISDPAVISAMLTLAETRGDCLYLVDPPAGLTPTGVAEWHNGGGDYDHTAFISSYGALYYDWCTIYDPVNSQQVSVPPSVLVAASIAYSDRNYEIWYAPAGLKRGLIRGAIGTETNMNKSDVDALYSGTNHINSIYNDPQVGLVLWGQKTLHRQNTALDRINVRRLLNYLKRVIVAACKYLIFEPNDTTTWNSFDNLIRPTLENIKIHRGLYDYKIMKGSSIITDEDIDNYRMPCMLIISPTKAAEEIPIYFTISNTGADFNEVLDSITTVSY